MNYVVVDLEWNQAMSSKSSVFNKLPIHLRGEIIEIGAVKLTEDMQPGEEFTVDVKPVYFRRMHYKVKKITGFDKERLAQGIAFADALEQFRAWCGDDVTFITWGCDDQGIMEQNIIIHDLDWDWIAGWINLQLIYNLQTGGDKNQKSLASAMEHFEIEQTRVAHDALGDAYHTALICSRLDLKQGIADYGKALKSHEDGLHGAQVPGCISRKVYHGYANKQEAFSAMAGAENLCPVCQAQMKITKWYPQQGKRYLTMTACPTHGKHWMRIRLIAEEDGTLQVNRMLYEADSEAAQVYEQLSEKPRRPKRRSRRSRAEKRQQISNKTDA